jgi:aconitate hydratase
MGKGVVEKIIEKHLVEGEMQPGKEIGLRIDHTLTQDATGTMAYLEFEAMGLDRVRNELAVSYIDHNTVQVGPENADDHAFLRSAAAKYGVVFSPPGNGICHQLHLERFGEPGKTLLGSDSHTATGGGIGMLAIGAGGIDVAAAMGARPFFITMPRVVKIELTGSMPAWVSAKDVILKVLEIFGTKGNVGVVFEYGGEGADKLDVPERATITNMGAECGVTSSVFPSDSRTKEFLDAQGRGDSWTQIVADEDAAYDKVVKIDLSSLEPLAATPHSPGNIATVASLGGTGVNQVLIGSCTNSSYRDLKTVAKILEGRHVDPEVSFGVASGSRQVLKMIMNEGLLMTMMDAGARMLESACGFCIGNSVSPGTDAVSVRTSNRNFEGRSGTPSADIYLVSPEIAAVAALYGRFIDPRMVDDLEYPRVGLPKKFDVDDSMFKYPPEDSSGIELEKSSNIGTVPVAGEPQNSLAGSAVIKVGDKITTDHIMPAGARLKYRSNIEKYSRFVFEGVDPEFVSRAEAEREQGRAGFIVAGESYGQGSSREHAAMCPMYLGVRAVVARSIERIHRTNLINFGILPAVFESESDYEAIETGDKLELKGAVDCLKGGKMPLLSNKTRGTDIPVRIDLSSREKDIMLAGGLLNYVRKTAG